MSGCNCKTDCGCQQVNAAKDYMLVKATGQSAQTCQQNAEDAAQVQCLKSESTYDKVLNDFSIPAIAQTISVMVCNASIYYVGQWLYFPVTSDRLQIASKSDTNNVLYLRNGCTDFVTPIADNRDPGNIIAINSPFIVCDSPDCTTAEELSAKLLSAINLSECIQVDALKEAGVTEKVQFVGRVISDPNNSGFKKCIKRIVGFFADLNGRLFAEKLSYMDENNVTRYTEIMLDTSTKEIVRRKLPSSRGISSTKQYGLVQYGGATRYVENARTMIPLLNPIVIKDSSNLLITGALVRTVGDITVTNATPYQTIKTLDGSEIDAITFNVAEFYALVELQAYAGSSVHADVEYADILLNDVNVGKIPTFYSAPVSITTLVKCTKVNKQVKLRIETDKPSGNIKLIINAKVKALYI